jgi:uncharacterized RDD family membrane protein YckC
MPTNLKQLDTSVQITTPENIAFRYELAGPFRRLPAYLIDLLIRLSTVAGLIFLVGVLGVAIDGAAVGLILLVLFVVEWF